ncbi:MAG: hypothetical protein OEV08_12460, partial [Nitrospira sp.]|nr:hypothetical protein [Nitrospira sp.]
FPGKSAIETMATLDSVRKTIEAVTLYLRGEEYVWEAQRDTAKTGTRNRALPITLSIGVAERPSKDATLNVVIKSAYRALYEAKVAGGNVVKRGMESIPSARRPYAESGRVAASREIEM